MQTHRGSCAVTLAEAVSLTARPGEHFRTSDRARAETVASG